LCVCEIKGADRINDSHAVLCDLIRIGCFSKDAIDIYSNQGVLGIHVVGRYFSWNEIYELVDKSYLQKHDCFACNALSIGE
jgi:hypothetical protein